jgi:hypothetical protein
MPVDIEDEAGSSANRAEHGAVRVERGAEALRSAALAVLVIAVVAMTILSMAAAEETVVVTTTRVPSLVGAEPIRIEAVPSEEIEHDQAISCGYSRSTGAHTVARLRNVSSREGRS